MTRVKGRLIEAPRDANQPSLVDDYESLGCSVVDLGSIAEVSQTFSSAVQGSLIWGADRVRGRSNARTM